MKQLKMVVIKKENKVGLCDLPEGYHYEFYNGDEAQISDWLDICINGLIGDKSRSIFDECILNCPGVVAERDLFFVVDPEGKRVATTTVYVNEDGDGYVHMVASCLEARGKGIGLAMITFGLSLLDDRDCERIVLTTDDHRLAAIKTYLNAGFHPVIYFDEESDMKVRWDEVIKKLNYQKDVIFLEE